MLETINKKSRSRIILSAILCFALVTAIIFRLFKIQIIDHQFYVDKLNLQRERVIPLPARRGNIYDCNKKLLATTIDSFSVYILNNKVKNQYEMARKLASIIGLDVSYILDRIKREANFVWIRRKITDPRVLAELKSAKIEGVYWLDEQKRFYLYNDLASHVLGYVDLDNKGQSGVDFYYQDYLYGIDGKIIESTAPYGKSLYSAERVIQEPKNGFNLILTIDEFIQYQSKKYLKQAFEQYQADTACAIALDIRNGEILSMISLPDYNPNSYWQYPLPVLRNNNVQSIYEPGSTFKLITVSAALGSNLFNLKSKFKNGNLFEYGGKKIREAHLIKNPDKVRQVKDILIESLNIGAAKLAIKIGKNTLFDYIQKFGFTSKTGIDLPGESAGLLKNVGSWYPVELATISFGHGIAVTPVQLASAVAAIANDGEWVQPHIVKGIYDQTGSAIKMIVPARKKILDKQISWEIRKIMKEAVERGTGVNAYIEGYSVGGKTGTSQKVNLQGKGYLKNAYVSSFVGVFPIEDPQILILIVIDNPKGKYYYGSSVAAPVFRQIADEIIRYKNIPPN